MARERKQTDSQIPDDLVVEILSLIRPKSLARFLCLSKKWRSMILEQNSNTKEEQLLLISSSSIQSIDFTDPETEIKAITLLEFPVQDNFHVVGSANGLLLYVDSANTALILFNPWTQTRQTIRITVPKPLTRENYVYGFAYDKSNDNYVIVVIDNENHNGFTWSSNTQNWIAFLKSFNPGLWKFTYPSPNVNYYQGRTLNFGLFVNGSIYWKILSKDENTKYILCFDSKTFKFNVIVGVPNFEFRFDLVKLGDRLAAVELILRGSMRTEVWELGEQMGWRKIMTIPCFDSSHDDVVPLVLRNNNAPCYELVAPVLLLESGDFILMTTHLVHSPSAYYCIEKDRFHLYNYERKVTRLNIQGITGISYHSISCKKNLLSPILKEDAEHQLQDLEVELHHKSLENI